MADLISPITDVVSRLCNCISNRVIYIRELEENLTTLGTSSDALAGIRNDVKRRVEIQEANQLMRRTEEVAGWLLRADNMANEVNDILTEGRKDIEKRCFGGCCPRNCCASYKLGKKVVRITREVQTLRDEGRGYHIVAEPLPEPPVQEMPTVSTTGMDLMFRMACNYISEEEVGIMGIYGIGGVGKTTLLKKINNEFLPSRTPNDFDVVICVVVSKEIRMLQIQKEIADRLELTLPEDGSLDYRATKLYSVLSKKKFVLLLDDIWDRVDLLTIGIPLPNIHNKSKVLFTTRSELVCGKMEAHKKIRVECLGWLEAWQLFQVKVGQEALNSDPQITALAQDVAKECAGLPLALITIGRAMASRKKPEEWKHAATTLKKSASEFPGITDELFPILKFSYDSLSDDTIKSCFLHCSLFPEDSSIFIDYQLIPYWIGEGFLDTFEDIDEARNRGHDIVGILKQACLLETDIGYEDEECVKMHDVLRDLALWIGCDCGRQKDKFLVRAGIGLREAPEVWKWREAKRISLMDNDIEMLEDEAPTCPNLLTLILQENQKLCRISDGFFQYMHALRVLDLSETSIEELPRSVAELVELQYLDLSYTKIRQLPGEIKSLVKLKCLKLRGTIFLESIPSGTLSRLSKLQWFDIVDGAFDVSEAFLEELECLKDLKYLSIEIRKAASVKRFLGSNKFMRCTLRLHIRKCDDLTSLTLPNSSNLEAIRVYNCNSLKVICGGALDGYFPKLREVDISDCNELEDFSCIHGAPNLTTIEIMSTPKLTRLCGVGGIATGCFTNLKIVHIVYCLALKDLSWLRGAPNLHRILIRGCDTLAQQYKDGVMAEYFPTNCRVAIDISSSKP